MESVLNTIVHSYSIFLFGFGHRLCSHYMFNALIFLSLANTCSLISFAIIEVGSIIPRIDVDTDESVF